MPIIASLDELFAVPPRLAGPRWFGISGSWRTTNDEVERDVRAAVAVIMERGEGVVSGGALGVDYFATNEALLHDPLGKRIKIFLPLTLDRYATHYRTRGSEGVVTPEQAEMLIDQLTTLKEANASSLVEDVENMVANKETYFLRNTMVVEASDALLAFQVNDSEGVQDTIDKALSRNLPVYLRRYTID